MDILLLNSRQSTFDLVQLAKKGIPKADVMRLAKHIALSVKELTLVLDLSERTLHRYERTHLLDKNSSERAILLAKLYQRGETVWGDLAMFQQWMKTENKYLKNAKPIDMLDTLLGFELVNDEIGRIEHGILA